MEFDYKREQKFTIDDLLKIMKILRGEGGCPWDRAQDHHSIRNNFIEETCEAVEAIDREDAALLKEELGDVLLQIVFHSAMEEEKGSFSFLDVTDSICRKLIFRHPFLFAGEENPEGKTPDERWDEMKQKEKHYSSATEYLDQVSRTLPALMRAQKLVSRSRKKGLQQREPGSVAPARECLDGLALAAQNNDLQQEKDLMGQLLFMLADFAESQGFEAEEALSAQNERFLRRFAALEVAAGEQYGSLEQCSPDEIASLWGAVTTYDSKIIISGGNEND